MRAIVLFILLLLISVNASADRWQFKNAGRHPGSFIAGFLTGYAAHELGHIVVAESLGFDAEFDGLTIVYPESEMSDAEHLQVASSGFQTQWLVSEAALRYRENRPMSEFGDNFNAGLVFSHLAITAAYMSVLMHHDDGDIEGISDATGLSNEKLAALASIPAILDAWRLFGRDVPSWAPAISIGSKAVGFSVIWTY